MNRIELEVLELPRLIPYAQMSEAQQACFDAISIINHSITEMGSYHIRKWMGQELLHRLTKAITEEKQ